MYQFHPEENPSSDNSLSPTKENLKDAAQTDTLNNNGIETQSFMSSVDQEMSDTSSPASIDSDILLGMINQEFADHISKSKSLQRVSLTPDPIPEFTAWKERASYTKISHLQIPDGASSPPASYLELGKDADETAQSPSSLHFEKSSKPISAVDDDDNHDNRNEKAEIPLTEWPCGLPTRVSSDKNTEGHQLNELVKSSNNSRSCIMSINTLDCGSPHGSSDSFKLPSEDLVELKQAKLSPSSTCSVHSANSNAIISSFLHDKLNHEAKRDSNSIILPKTNPRSSKASLHQIESFHRQFVGDLALLSGTTGNVDVVDEKKTLGDPLAGGEKPSLGDCNCNSKKELVGVEIKEFKEEELLKNTKVLADQNHNGYVNVDGNSAESFFSCRTDATFARSNSNKDVNDGDIIEQSDGGECTEQEPLIPPSSLSSDSSFPAEIITSFVKSYIVSLEEEWKTRRNVWLENNKHNPNVEQEKSTVYAYETFREYMTTMADCGQIALQVPILLPDVAENNNSNPILQDEILPTQKDSSKELLSEPRKQRKSSLIPKLIVATCTCDGSGPTTIQKVNDIEEDGGGKQTDSINSLASAGKHELSASTTTVDTEIEDEEEKLKQFSPVDLSPFLKQHGGILNDIKSHCQKDRDKVGEIIGDFVKKYIDFLEDEWKRRRDEWIAKNIPDEEHVYRSVKTFNEALEGDKVPPQFPYTLPSVTPIDDVTTPSAESEVKMQEESANAPSKDHSVAKTWWESIFGKSGGDETEASKPEINDTVHEDTIPIPVDTITEDIIPIPVDTVLLQQQQNSDGFGNDGAKAVQEIEEMEKKIAAEAGPVVMITDATEPLVEIYRGLSREDTNCNLKGSATKPQYQAFVNGRTVLCNSLEQKTRLDVCSLKLNTVQNYAPNLRDMMFMPGVKVLEYLSLPDFMNCRLVSRNWNNAVISHKTFLTTTTFVVAKKPLGALATLEASRVRWQHLRCSILPSMNFTTASSYNGRFQSSKLRVTQLSSRNEPVTHTLTTVIFENIDIHKQQLVQWIQNCKRLNSIEIRQCNFLKTTISMDMDKTNKVIERVQVMKFLDMDVVKLVEALRFFLPATRRLQTLEIIQRKQVKGTFKSATFTTRKGAEDDIASVLCPAIKKNAPTLKNIRFELSSSKNYLLQTKIIETFQNATFRLNSLSIRSFSPSSTQPCFKLDSYGSSRKNLISLLKSTLINSKEMTLLDFPMLSIDFVGGEDGSHLLSPKLEKLGVQLEMPEQETKLNLGVLFPHLSQLDVYSPLDHSYWLHIRETMPGLTKLVVYSTGVKDSQLQSIIRNLKHLQVLHLDNVQDVTDFGITGMEQGWIERLKMYWPEKIDTNATQDQFPQDKIRFSGKSLSSLGDLHTFIMKGDFSISNVGILYGFNSRELRRLELRGSPVNVSNSGLFILGYQCPRLLRVQIAVQHSKANQSGIRDFYGGLEEKYNGNYQIDILPES